MVDDARLLTLCQPGEDAVLVLEALAQALDAPVYQASSAVAPPEPTGDLSPASIGQLLSRALPPQAIVSVEGGTCGYPFYAVSHTAAVHTTLTNTGGAIGQGLPAAMGAALACPDRKVVALLSDGSTQYTVQTLWSLAHENLNVLVLIAANHQYAILRNELRRGGATLSPQSQTMTALDKPCIDWVGLANAYGVSAVRVHNCQELSAELSNWMQHQGPALIEMSL
jgi:acetolactate synthase-1/2/3 large subunit